MNSRNSCPSTAQQFNSRKKNNMSQLRKTASKNRRPIVDTITIGDAEALAFAHLCAAAPGLLEAAKAVVRLAEGQTMATTMAAALHRLEAVAVAAAPPAQVLQ